MLIFFAKTNSLRQYVLVLLLLDPEQQSNLLYWHKINYLALQFLDCKLQRYMRWLKSLLEIHRVLN